MTPPMNSPHVLLLTRDTLLASGLCTALAGEATLNTAATFPDCLREMHAEPPAVLIVDARHTSDGGHQTARFLELVQSEAEPPPILVLTGDDCPEPIERRIACDGLQRQNDAGSLAGMIRDRLNAATATHTLRFDPPEPHAGIDGLPAAQGDIAAHFETNSASLRRMLDDLSIAASHDVTILLIGETGAGKTYLSRLIHDASPRRDAPFIHVACGALPRELIESELFGHAKGAFTSAHADKEGKFVAAGRGTILLDEIDVLGPEQQVKLLRVIETGEFEPVGSNRTQKSQARLVVASNLELQPLVEQGKFRPDLYYRLNMLKFDLPPVRKRRVDIIPLARRFIEKYSRQLGIRVEAAEDAFFDALMAYPWPGNVRELEYVVQRAVIYCREGRLRAAQLPPHIVLCEAGPVNDPSVRLPTQSSMRDLSLGSQVALTERDLIEEALARNNHSRTNTARELGISRVTLYNKMKRYAILT
jgi:DNA-binding NtrC family response regulator